DPACTGSHEDSFVDLLEASQPFDCAIALLNTYRDKEGADIGVNAGGWGRVIREWIDSYLEGDNYDRAVRAADRGIALFGEIAAATKTYDSKRLPSASELDAL